MSQGLRLNESSARLKRTQHRQPSASPLQRQCGQSSHVSPTCRPRHDELDHQTFPQTSLVSYIVTAAGSESLTCASFHKEHTLKQGAMGFVAWGGGDDFILRDYIYGCLVWIILQADKKGKLRSQGPVRTPLGSFHEKVAKQTLFVGRGW